MNVSTDTDRCIGSGNCVMTAPEVFDQDDAGLVLLLAAHPAEDDLGPAHNAARLCPARAITVSDDGD